MNYQVEYNYNQLKVNNLKITTWFDENRFNKQDYESEGRVQTSNKNSLDCKHEEFNDKESGDIICKKCFVIISSEFINDNEDDKIKNFGIHYWKRDYDRARWTTYAIEYMKGYKNDELPRQLWLQLAREVPDPLKWYDIYKVFHNYQIGKDKNRTGVSDHWMGFGAFFKIPIIFNEQILYYAEKYSNKKINKNRINYNYLLYKFTQLFGDIEDQAKFIPLKGSKTWCENMDIWWKKFCLKEWFEFKPTKIYQINWCKQKELHLLDKSLNPKVIYKHINKELYYKIFNETYKHDKDTDEIELIWKYNELLFINHTTKEKYNKTIKYYKYKHNQEWKYFNHLNNEQIEKEEYYKNLQIK